MDHQEVNVPHISVVIPSYNYARYVTEAVESALKQTLPPLEVIVVDDGSMDNTQEVMKTYAGNPHVRYIRQENRGLSGARNTGIRHASGCYIALLDADDRWKPDKLERQLAKFASDDGVGLVFCGKEHFNEHGVMNRAPALPETCDRILDALVTSHPFCPSSVLVRKRCFEECGYFDESLKKVEDREMWIRIAKRYPFGCVEDCLVEFRLHPQAWNLGSKGMVEAFRTTLERAFSDGPLERRWLLRAKAYAFMHFDFSWIYHMGREHNKALWHLILSILCYPLPDWAGRLFQGRFARWRRLFRYTLTPHKL